MSRPIFNIVNKWDYLHIWIDVNTIVAEKSWWINFKVMPNEIKQQKDEFWDLLPLENKIFTKR